MAKIVCLTIENDGSSGVLIDRKNSDNEPNGFLIGYDTENSPIMKKAFAIKVGDKPTLHYDGLNVVQADFFARLNVDRLQVKLVELEERYGKKMRDFGNRCNISDDDFFEILHFAFEENN